jgi:hypothetical protein
MLVKTQNQNFEMEDSRAEITEVVVNQFWSARPAPRAIDAAWWWWLRLNIQRSASNLPCLGFSSSFGSRCRETSQDEDIVDSLTPFHSRRLNFNGICEASNTDVRCVPVYTLLFIIHECPKCIYEYTPYFINKLGY